MVYKRIKPFYAQLTVNSEIFARGLFSQYFTDAEFRKNKTSALDKLLGQLGIYPTWLSSIAYLQKQLPIFIFLAMFFSVITRFLLHETIGNVLAYLFTPIICLSKVSN